jgi:hypothetical protein
MSVSVRVACDQGRIADLVRCERRVPSLPGTAAEPPACRNQRGDRRGESGARPCQCTRTGCRICEPNAKRCVPVFFRRWGGVHKGQSGRLLNGSTWERYPAPPARPWGANRRGPIARASRVPSQGRGSPTNWESCRVDLQGIREGVSRARRPRSRSRQKIAGRRDSQFLFGWYIRGRLVA